MGIFQDDHRFLCRIAVVESNMALIRTPTEKNIMAHLAGFTMRGLSLSHIYTRFALKRVRVQV